MNDNDFYRTPMGQRFYNHTVPQLSENLARIANLLERLVVAMEKKQAPSGREQTK